MNFKYFVILSFWVLINFSFVTLNKGKEYGYPVFTTLVNSFNQEIDHKEYPKDLKTSKLFYIKAAKGKNFDKIKGGKLNSILISAMKKKYNGDFTVFDNNYLEQKKDYFIRQGYKYRLFLYYQTIQKSPVSYTRSSGLRTATDISPGRTVSYSKTEQSFQLVFENIETGELYGNGNFYWRNRMMNNFFRAIRYY